ncbi:hypothetical protein HMPREF0972_00022 [Actinomyces sp. oral taxon 848 str. F0332]|nr:hypothetical protein HMPREF0972_00022 [Actinomyces sp. oral taxon 848 str. F0332]
MSRLRAVASGREPLRADAACRRAETSPGGRGPSAEQPRKL